MATALTCPAASGIHPAADAPSVLCGVLAQSNRGAHVRGFQSRGQVSPVMSGSHDPATIATACAGDGVPGSQLSYCACAIWRAGKQAEWAGRRGPDALRDEHAVRRPEIDTELLAEAVGQA